MPSQKATSFADDLAAITTPADAPPSRSFADDLADVAAPKERQSDSGALLMAGARAVAPVARRAVEEVATNPGVPRAAAAIGRGVGAVEGAIKGGPLAIGPGAWAGGKAGWFSGKFVQGLAAPVSKAAEAVAPYAQALSTASGAQGALDLAQMSEPTRHDIGVLGVGVGQPRSDAEKAAHPALINAVVAAASDDFAKIRQLIERGLSQGEAVRKVLFEKMRKN